MTVKELLELLQACDPESEVFVADTSDVDQMCGTWPIVYAMWSEEEKGVAIFFDLASGDGGPHIDMPKK